MTDSQTPEIPQRTGRRDFLKNVGKVAGGIAAGVVVGRVLPGVLSDNKSSEVALTAEQAEKQNALRELKGFMEEYTSDKTVSNFLVNASSEDINKSFTLAKIPSLYYADPVNAWQLKVPVDSGETVISYRNKKMNPNEGSGDFQNVRVYLGKDGRIVAIPSSGIPTTLDETKHAFDQFTSRPLVNDSDWKKDETGLSSFSAGYRPIEGGKEIHVGAHAEGLMSITISDAAPSSSPTSAGSVA